MIPQADIFVNAPNRKTGGQLCSRLHSDYLSSIVIDDKENQMLHFPFTNFPPYGVKAIAIDTELFVKSAPRQVETKSLERYLLGDRFCEIREVELINQANLLRSNTPKETAKKIFLWVSTVLKKTGYQKSERGALWGLRNKEGDCTEFMHLFIALCRINGIAARGVSGYRVVSDTRLSPSDYHDWAQIFLDGRWQIADPYYNVFLEKEEEYVAFRVHGPQREENFFHRWQSSDPRLKVVMTK
ncbi:MAG: transglutaminase domain-containing protein [Proteobacteria bacterium]|nr:transglutaminase domain-containing protein [Pseudomonadota bacterium]MBU1419760.1 transglutaminase domain-containing protein [Pseudomonadota bacterium]MBU1456661.1 transglutaminase domain-containing protein [Pseudomonadota bacterium]